jgi:hypothetical protein
MIARTCRTDSPENVRGLLKWMAADRVERAAATLLRDLQQMLCC